MMKENKEGLILFLEMRKREKERNNLLLKKLEEFDDSFDLAFFIHLDSVIRSKSKQEHFGKKAHSKSDLAFSKVDLLDASSSSIALDDFNALNSLWHEFGNQVVGVKNCGLEYPCWRDRGSLLIGESDDTHDIP
ncbi:hypothetical protein F0562_035461 [Nyssa sinensis]|uniref:Uncharacterized protein n=1 Tax=Nyssa sinensis TaxID=561372 RepID=A0A5J5AAV2_9ASTE|nr:hypothetical protein F0562_035461 [Nyssa sinensis]